MTAPAPNTLNTLQLSRVGNTYSTRERAAWLRGFLAGLSTAVFGTLGALVLIAVLF